MGMHNLRRLVSYTRPHAGWLVAGALLMAVVGLLEGAITLLVWPLMQVVLDPSGAAEQVTVWDALGRTIYLSDILPFELQSAGLLVVLTIVVVYFIKAACEYLGDYSLHRLGYAVVMDLRNHLYGHTLRQSLSFFHRRSTGQLMSTTVNDIERVQQAVSHFLADSFRQAFTLLVLLGLVLAIDWRLTLVCFATVPIIVFPVSRLGHRIRRISRRAQEQLGDLNDSLQETYSGVRIVQAFGAEGRETGKFRQRALALFQTQLRWVRNFAVASPMMEVLGAVTVGGLVLLARQRIAVGAVAPGMMIDFVVALARVYMPVKRLVGIYGLFQQALGASERVFECIDMQEQVKERPGARDMPIFRNRIEFDNVAFAYPNSPGLLRNINLTVSAGEVVAVVGSSGAGKTTLVNLLPRFFDVSGGSIRIDGTDIRDFRLDSLRAQIGIVTQETVLFNDTVRANIAYGQPRADDAQVRKAAEVALATEFIADLPQGYGTSVGERGVRLSGGQRQRLAIARALLKDSPILILDEATSELDMESDLLVQRALANLMRGRTVFVIAHRLSTIRGAHKIVVLEDGEIREVGRHQELLAHGGLYQRLYEMQFVDLDSPLEAASSRGTS